MTAHYWNEELGQNTSIAAIRVANPGVSIPAGVALPQYHCYPLYEDERPDHDPTTQYLHATGPTRVGDTYVRGWAVMDYTPTELVDNAVGRREDMVCTALQGMLAIDAAGLAPTFTAWASDPARTFAEKAFLDKAQTWRRTDPTLSAAATAFNLTDEQLDGLFALAATFD